MPLSVAQLQEPPSAGPPSASEGEEPERMPGEDAGLVHASKVQQRKHLPAPSYASRTTQNVPSKEAVELCQQSQPHRRWHKVRCKRSGSRRPNGVHLAGLPHCQFAGVDCAWVLHGRNRARGLRCQASITASNTLLLLVHDATLHGCVGSVANAKGTITQQTRR